MPTSTTSSESLARRFDAVDAEIASLTEAIRNLHDALDARDAKRQRSEDQR